VSADPTFPSATALAGGGGCGLLLAAAVTGVYAAFGALLLLGAWVALVLFVPASALPVDPRLAEFVAETVVQLPAFFAGSACLMAGLGLGAVGFAGLRTAVRRRGISGPRSR
jgi:hypothetical protein